MKIERAKIIVRGAVQGVGFRPFIFRLAVDLGLYGHVLNSSQGVYSEVEGPREALDKFLLALESEKPAHARIQSLEFSFLDAVGYERFEILPSRETGERRAFILPDIATCRECLHEIFDPQNRRYLYPFTNCTHCGPRFSIIESLPYDRPNTAMKGFALCPACDEEYHNPANRRFHAQPTACPTCGPRLELWDADGNVFVSGHDALAAAAVAIREGWILALKGLGGFQLLVDAREATAVRRLRERKNREEKPFAVMFPNPEAVNSECKMNTFEERLLQSPEAPIVLLKRSPASKSEIAALVAPKNPNLGVMLPCTPLHHILMRELNFPVVATSGNFGGEPICIDENEALLRLGDIADLFLVHNRPIVRHLDDSIARVVFGREQIIRRARGYAPLPIKVKSNTTAIVLATGSHLKNTVALAVGENVFLSQHIGDLETEAAHAAFQRTANDLQRLYDVTPNIIACDLHPEYLSSKWAEKQGVAVVPTQHHYTHVLSCAAENEIAPPLLGVAWDGTGLGTDGKIWGGEFLLLRRGSFERVAHLREFPLPGGDLAIRQPRRAAIGLLWTLFGEKAFNRATAPLLAAFSKSERSMIRQMLSRQFNSPLTSSAGRLFDAVASLLGLRQIAGFEGQAAMDLEFAAREEVNESYPIELLSGTPVVVDWRAMILNVLKDIADGVSVGDIAAKCHNFLTDMIVEIAKRIGEPKIALTGGCFQNRYLLENSVLKLQAAGFKPYWHQRVPANDGGIALGQAVAAMQPFQSDPLLPEFSKSRPAGASLAMKEL